MSKLIENADMHYDASQDNVNATDHAYDVVKHILNKAGVTPRDNPNGKGWEYTLLKEDMERIIESTVLECLAVMRDHYYGDPHHVIEAEGYITKHFGVKE